MNHDFELPNGFQDADFEMRDLEAKGNRSYQLRKAGICTHGWLQGPPGKPVTTCLYCGATFESSEAAFRAGNEAMGL